MIWYICNVLFYRIHCFFCDKLVDSKLNILKYAVRDNNKLQKAYVCHKCSKELFVEKQVTGKLESVYNGDLDEDATVNDQEERI